MASYDDQQENIASPDLAIIPETSSDIINFYSGTILLNGATGFLGKLFLEKLLRVCSKVDKIYVIIRSKNNKNPATRLREIFELPIFDLVRMKHSNAMRKVILIEADISEENLGLAQQDREQLIENVDCIINCAQSNRFEENLKNDIDINIRATNDLVNLAREIKNLKIFIQISTAFISPTQNEIEEIPYNSKMTPDKLLSLIKVVAEDKIQQAAHVIIGQYPNTYIFTKSVSEQLFQPQKLNFPVAIIRPSLVGATFKEPIAGWSENTPENIETIADCVVGAGLGYIRVLQLKPDAPTELVPADFLINCSLVAAWKTSISSTTFQNDATASDENLVKIYNFVSSPDTKITLEKLFNIGQKQVSEIPSLLTVWAFFVTFTPQTWLYLILRLLYHTLPAIVGDFVAPILGKTPQLRDRYHKIDKSLGVFSYYASKEWTFSNDNVRNLWTSLSGWEKTIFDFNMVSFDWEYYLNNLIKGYRVYVLKDSLDTLKEAREQYKKFKLAHYAMITVITMLGLFILLKILNLFV